MITKIIENASRNKYSQYGFEHFLIKYGISSCEKNKILNFKFVFSCHNKEIDNKIKGWIDIKNKKIPIFEIPADLTNIGDLILVYSDEEKKYPCIVFSTDKEIIMGFDIFKEIGYSLSGILENVWGNIGNEKNNIVSTPFLDYYDDFIFDLLLSIYKKSNLPFIHKSFWPYGKSFAVCLTHDVDEIKKTYQWITYPLKLVKKHDIKGIYNQFHSFTYKIKGNEPYWTFEKIIEIESNLDAKSSFFFLNETGEVKLFDKKTWRHKGRRYNFDDPKVVNIIKKLDLNGWDVGLHGSFYSYNDSKKIQKEKKLLENVLNHKIQGIRQHNLNLKIPDTWLYQEKAGLVYDTTLGFNDRIGFRWGTCFPFKPFYTQENRALNVLEIPLIIEDLPFFRYNNPWEEFLKIIREIEKHGGVITLLWHHSVFNKYEFPGWSDAYEKIIKFCKKKNAWVTSAKEISDWWRWREKTDFEWEYDETCLKIIPYPKKSVHFLNIYLPKEMNIKKISNAKVIKLKKELLMIQTSILKNNEYVEIEFKE